VEVKSLGQKAFEREDWASMIKKAKALRGPYSQGVYE
jgi:hypothetical protein